MTTPQSGSLSSSQSGPLSSDWAPLPRAPSPAALWQAVLAARVVLARCRRGSGGNVGQEAGADLLDALEVYVESLEARRLPVPYAIRDELRIRRLASGSSSRSSAGPSRRRSSRGD